MSDIPHPESQPDSEKFSHRFSPRAIMAGAIGVLVLTLSLGFGWFGNAWDFVHQRMHHQSATHLYEEIQLAPADDSRIFIHVDSPPRVIGGLEALQKKIRYPEIARTAGIEGRVFLQFAVEKDGGVSNIMVTRGIGGGCDEEAVRALGETTFVAGTNDGVPVRVKMSLPVSFRLN